MAKVWFITGASSGFGAELAKAIIEKGDKLAATFRKEEQANGFSPLAELIGNFIKGGGELWTCGSCAKPRGITEANLSLLKSGKVKGLRFATLEAICRYLECQPGDLLEYVPDEAREAFLRDKP